MDNDSKYSNSTIINGTAAGFTLAFLLTSLVLAWVTGEWGSVWRRWWLIQITPCPLVTDYFYLGGVSATFLNAGICGAIVVTMMLLFKGDSHPNTIAGFFLVIAHCFYGLNMVNMLPCFLAMLLYLAVTKHDINDNLHVAMFSTAFGPFVSELLFRYTQRESFVMGAVHLTWSGLLLTVAFVLMLAFTLPPLLPGAKAWHKGYNLYNGGLAFGIYGFMLFSLLYKTLEHPLPTVLTFQNSHYELWGQSYQLYANVFFITVFTLCFLIGHHLNGGSLVGIDMLYRSTGYTSDFAKTYGMPLCLINIGMYGMFFLGYLNLAVLMTTGVGFTGPTVGVMLAALTFTCSGQHVRNVWPIILGYQALYVVAWIGTKLAGHDITWSISTQAYINGVAFATGLCPIVGRYGNRAGVIAGFLCASMCTATRDLHGGLMLYNGGLTAGLTALILIPLLEHYHPDVATEQMHGKNEVMSLVRKNEREI